MRSPAKTALLAALSMVWPAVIFAQQAGTGTGGLQIDIDVDTSLTRDSNFALTPGASLGSSTISDTTFSFGLKSVTSAYDLSLTASTVLRFAEIPGRSLSGFEDPTFGLRFVTDNTNSRLTLAADYRKVDRDFLDPAQVEKEEQIFGPSVGSGGTLTSTNYDIKYETGLTAPLGFVFELSHDNDDYENVASPSVVDERTDTARVTANLRFSQVASARAFASLTQYEAQDTVQTDRETTNIGLGLAYDISPTVVFDGQIAQTDVETQRTSGLTTRSGVSSSATLTKSVANGSVFGTFSSTVNQNGSRESLSFGRDLQFPNSNLRAVVGLTRGDVGDTDWIASVRYAYKLKSSTLTFNVDRVATTSSRDQEQINTLLNVKYAYEIDSLSKVELSMGWSRQEDGGTTGAPTIDRTTLQASYTRNLTQFWALSSGVTYRKREETGLADANSTALFLSLGRTFSFRP